MSIFNKILKKTKNEDEKVEKDEAKKEKAKKDVQKEIESKKVEKKDDQKKEKKVVDKEAEKQEVKKKDIKKSDQKKEKTVSKTKKVKKVVKEKIPAHHFEIIEKPHVSEKAFNLESEGKYVFVISPSANKSEVKKAIQNLYGVAVKSVNIVKVPSKPKRFKGVPGVKSGYKKAVVTLAKGYSIDVMKETK